MSILIKYRLFVLTLMCVFSINIQSQSVGGVTSGSASYCVGNNSGFISLTGYVGTILFWESSIDGANWTNIPNPTSTQSYLNLTQTTDYRAIVKDGAFPQDTSTISTITLYTPAEGGSIAGGGTFCMQTGGGTLTLSGEVGNVVNWQFSIDGGTIWSSVTNTTVTLNYTSITENTLYAAVVENVPSCPVDTSLFASFFIDSTSDAGSVAGEGIICMGVNDNELMVSGEYGIIQDWISSTDAGSTWSSEGVSNDTLANQNLTQTTLYSVIVQNGVCPADTSVAVELTVVNPSPVDAGADVTITLHENTTIEATGNGSVVWSPSTGLEDPLSASTVASPIATTQYTVVLTDNNGCLSSDSMMVSVSIPIPSAITPNNDNTNDFFVIDKIENVPDNSLTIFNRHGNVVYDKAPYDNSWNGVSSTGKELPDGIYYYVLEYGDDIDPVNGYVLIKR